MDQTMTKDPPQEFDPERKADGRCEKKSISELETLLSMETEGKGTNASNVSLGNKSHRENELLQRLRDVLKRLEVYESTREAHWSLDSSILGIKDDFFVDDAKLPKHVEDNVKGIVKSAEDYIEKLKGQLRELDNADKHVEKSAVDTIEQINATYQKLLDEVCEEIQSKRNLMKLEAEVYKNEGLAPLKACRQEVNAQIRSSQRLIDLIQTLLKHPYTFNRDRLGKILNASSNMGRIPVVPLPEELPYVTFNQPLDSFKDEILERISNLGNVLRMGPVQITEIEERPASLYVKWSIIDPEFAGEEQTFILQKAMGEIRDNNSTNFETVYEGSEISRFLGDLPVGQFITLRVKIQGSETAWSVHRVSRTNLPGYSWDSSNKNYMITNSGRIAAKITDEISTVYSGEAQYDANYVIEFKFLEASRESSNDEGIALLSKIQDFDDTLKRSGVLFVTSQGRIVMDGEEKLMQLPKIRFGTKITITTTRKDKDTLRVQIECADKAVIYDWVVETPLYFAARLTESNKWNLMVR